MLVGLSVINKKMEIKNPPRNWCFTSTDSTAEKNDETLSDLFKPQELFEFNSFNEDGTNKIWQLNMECFNEDGSLDLATCRILLDFIEEHSTNK